MLLFPLSIRCIRRSSTGLNPKLRASVTGFSQKLGRLVVAIDVHVRQFVGFVTVEVDPIRTRSQNRRHGSSISRRSSIGDRLARPLMRSSMIYDEGLPYNIID